MFVNKLRILFVVYFIGAYVLAAVFSGLAGTSLLKTLLFLVGLVCAIAAGGALQVAHRTEERPVTDLVAAVLYPFAVYYVLFLRFDCGTQAFWIFTGYFLFLAITGGFVLGILLSPIIAFTGSYAGKDVRVAVRAGMAFISKLRGLAALGLALFVGIVIALGYYSTRITARFEPLSTVQKGVFHGLLALAAIVVLRFSYRHSIFSVMRDPVLKAKYAAKTGARGEYGAG